MTSAEQESVPPLDLAARLTLQRVVRILTRGGCHPQAIKDEVARSCEEIPEEWWRRADTRDAGDVAHVMTLWFSDPAYLDPEGNPRPLPLRGRTLSIEALARRVDPNLGADSALKYLEQGGVVKVSAGRYVPKDRALIFRGQSDVVPALAGFFGFVKTLDHNSQRTRKGRRWLQLCARNPEVPVSALPLLESKLRQLLRRFVDRADALMHLCERSRKPGEPTARLGIGGYIFEEDEPVSDPSWKQIEHKRTRRGQRRVR